MVIELPEESVVSHGSEVLENPWQLEWDHTVDSESVERFGVVTHDHGAAITHVPPIVLFPDRYFVTGQSYRRISVEHSECIYLSEWEWRLDGIVIGLCYGLSDGNRVGRGVWRMLILAPKVEPESAIL